MRRIQERKPVIVLGDGTNLWTFSHRDDVGRAIVSAIGNEKSYGKSYTVCGDKAISWETYYQTLAGAMGSPAVVFVHVPTDILFAAEPLKCDWCEYNFKHINVYDNSAAQRDLAYQTTITWADGAKRIVENAVLLGKIESTQDADHYDKIVNSMFEFRTALKNSINL